MHKLLSLLLLFSFISCSSRSELNIQSNPDKATVTLYNEQTGQNDVVGETPLKLSPSGNQKSIQLKLEKKGYVSENILLSGNLNNSKINVELKENDKWLTKDSKSLSRIVEDIAEGIDNINRANYAKDYSRSLEIINSLLNRYPDTAFFFDIRGSVLLLLNRREEAKSNFKKSIELNPSNLKTKAMLDKL